jgi:hypothetical protein
LRNHPKTRSIDLKTPSIGFYKCFSIKKESMKQ